MKNLVGRYLLFVTGLYFLAAGIVLILRSSLGTTPISSVNYVLSLNSALTLGTWTFVINMLLIAGQFWFIRDRMTRRDTVEILLQMPFSLLFGLFIDFNMGPDATSAAAELRSGDRTAVGRLYRAVDRRRTGDQTPRGHDERRRIRQLRLAAL